MPCGVADTVHDEVDDCLSIAGSHAFGMTTKLGIACNALDSTSVGVEIHLRGRWHDVERKTVLVRRVNG